MFKETITEVGDTFENLQKAALLFFGLVYYFFIVTKLAEVSKTY